MNILSPYWLSVDELGLSGSLVEEWNLFVSGPNHLGLRLFKGTDILFWEGNKANGQITPRSAYEAISSVIVDISSKWWFKTLWN